MIFIDFSQVLLKKRLKKSLELLCLKINKQKYNQMGGGNFLDKKEQILDLYYDLASEISTCADTDFKNG